MPSSILELNMFAKTTGKAILVRNGKLAGYLADSFEDGTGRLD